MKLSKVIKIAIGCTEKEMKRIVVEANLGLRGSDVPYHQKCKRRYEEMMEAIEVLEELKSDGT